ncbi:MAG: gamma-glutamyltransferase family protein [Burkholderiaceae bacterium]|jgi:gamma-glutamyltranspeptidase/glutathione hydrolase|nr:gamma-glutamyltransferase family protein [Burkholderiaceae bacterium]
MATYRFRLPRPAFALAAALLLLGCVGGNRQDAVPFAPEAASAWVHKPGWATEKFAVAAANPLAADAGYQVLKAGGSAVDAAVAVQMVLTLVEPQSSGIGGGAFLLHAAGAKVTAWDGRETAPADVDEKLFLNADGQPMDFYDAAVGGRAVGVPGVVRMLQAAHQVHGRLPWAQLIQPAIRLAERGFSVSPRLHALLKSEPYLKRDPVAARYFYDADGLPRPIGHMLKNPELARVLKYIARRGSAALHTGPVARAIVAKVTGHRSNPGKLSLVDLASYQPKRRQPICHDLRAPAPGKTYQVCGFPPPSSGAIAVGQILGILAQTPAAQLPLNADGQPSADWLYHYAEASRLAFADRALYVADPDFVSPPTGGWTSLLTPGYLAERARLIGPQPLKIAPPGHPGALQIGLAPMPAQPEHGTSHISIVDSHGNALAMTTSIENQFGARQMVEGFLLNNQLTDFSFVPADAQGRPVANRVQPGKRPRSSMAPTLVFEQNPDGTRGPLVMSTGSSGGALIIHYTAKTLHGVLNWGLTPQQAIDIPNFGVLTSPILLEAKKFPSVTVEQLRAHGSAVREIPMTSGLQALTRIRANGKTQWLGGADPRREGVVMGR